MGLLFVSQHEKKVKVSYPEDKIFNGVISEFTVALRETTFTISHSIETGSPVKTEIERVVSLSTTEISEIIRFKKQEGQDGSGSLT